MYIFITIAKLSPPNSRLLLGITLLTISTAMLGCGALDPSKRGVTRANPASALTTDEPVALAHVDWVAVLKATADRLSLDVETKDKSALLCYRSFGTVIEADSVYAGTKVQLLEWVTIPGIHRTSVVWAFTVLHGAEGSVIVLFDKNGGKLAASDLLPSTESDINHSAVTWTSHSEGRGGEGENYAKTEVTYTMFCDAGGNMILKGSERYVRKSLFGLSESTGVRKSTVVFQQFNGR